ncbi:isoprenylcysteine carboxylmethyltransferase family protein [Pseudomonas stutzeri]|uniref:methyltransferase family protein n=1 Tax=Stutzerimonas stutzeri TaxID=316 RepID=UPI000C9C8848|nr:isoprenylcysteine carboxylmethyltransferase family protein [Stutzerimonas stutzeri]MCQ4280367.1 isoprenylcysteine carboxylmethyltransferase family protein [Stutzerimonas stutzeri]PNF71304.1 isoprenylcysteine carboxylmethyltransferase family protein [Stutzerimonas stutzeri]
MSHASARLIPPPPLVYLAFMGCAWGLSRAVPLDLPEYELTFYAGWVVVAVGIALMLWSALEMFRYRTTINPYGKPSSLLQSGPFRFSRNPIYLADTFVYCGVGLLLNSVWPWLLLPLLIVCMQRTVIIHEEHLLLRLFGDDYRIYRRRVRRWL